ncbi:aldehyde dehydrogenase [Ottowia thiooxydans]|uniref:Acyl-CoA reductase-like NAD-dependent aldehyde dehydrogenase n=1 Tax=Ottowia thiooxydans TaxID=219182 RepID=A0ABV2Q4M3_9BURK
MQNYQMLIDGQWVDSCSTATLESINPYTGQVWAKIPRAQIEDADAAVRAAHQALKRGPWGRLTAGARSMHLRKLGDLITSNAETLARTEVQDNGKLYAEMRAQVNAVAQMAYFFAGLADKIEGSVPPPDRAGMLTYTRREPVGVVVCIVPWNSPLALLASKAFPALAAGCTLVVKPSEHASASSLEFGRLLELAGFPPGVVNIVTGLGAEIGEALVSHPLVAKIAFTGGESSGQRVNELAARDFKGVTMELGGKSPNIVFDDASLEDAVNGAVAGIFGAAGQTCIAGSRLLVQANIHDELVARLIAVAKVARMGDPNLAETQIGPIATKPQYQKILEYIQIAKDEGANCVLGGRASKELGGLFIEPTIFTGINNDMRIAREEVFGPVLSIIKFRDEAEALSIANDTVYGLAAGVWTQNMGRAFRVVNALEAGTVWVNTYRALGVHMPFGGVKRSGLGRENGIEAIEGYLHTKSVWLNYDAPTANPFVMRI